MTGGRGGGGPPEAAAVVCLGPGGAPVARRLADGLPGARLHARRAGGAEATAFDDSMEHLACLFAAGMPVVGVCAAGILIRAVAPLLDDKRRESPVVAVAEDGSVAVPLLGGHRGANALARACARLTGGMAAITTAGDVRFGVALDEPPTGWRLANPGDAKGFAAALLAGETVAVEGEAAWLAASELPFAEDAGRRIVVTERAVEGGAARLVFHPPRLALGVGCERGCEPAELAGLVDGALAEAGLARGAVACVASIDLKGDEAAVLTLAEEMAAPLRLFDARRLERETPRLANPSETVFAAVGCHGVAEAAALAAAGAGAELAVAKRRSRRATCALARAVRDIDAGGGARMPGRLCVTGLGPGGAALRTPEASRAIAGASDLVGYAGYLDLAGPLARGKRCHAFALGEEEARCRAALDLAGEGRRVALLCSGDPGVYAMASLVHELMDREPRPSWRAVEVAVVPGVSAAQLAAARAGAPLGHDFCVLSLSDLLTPRAVVLARLRAAAAGDFALALFNPASRRRRALLAEARAILLAQRAGDTPVVIGRLLGRAGESVTHTTLAELDAGAVDMSSIVLIGASTTRRYRHRGAAAVYTPRGYGTGDTRPPRNGGTGAAAGRDGAP